MTLRTVGSLVGAANAAKDLHAMAANFLLNFRKHANGVGGVNVPTEPFVAACSGVAGTAERPRLSMVLVWTERTTWQVNDYLSPDDDSFSESWGADNSCGYHIESSERQRQMTVTFDAENLLLPNDRQIELMRRWKADADAKEKERIRLAQIADLQRQIGKLQAANPNPSQGTTPTT